MTKAILKKGMNGLFLVLALPLAAVAGFGKLRAFYTFGAQLCALAPGLPGDYLRLAFYRMTLTECDESCRISFGSFFAQPGARVASGVYIGSYCVLGLARIGVRTQIASGVQILSGARQHSRDGSGRIRSADEGEFLEITVGEDCWIGASAIVMANVGDRSTIGAGSVVTREIPGDCVAAGSPARAIRSRLEPLPGER
jgi:acetyltransferase-like isoleucine patch superfamily enzyme